MTARYHAALLLEACKGHDTLLVGIDCPIEIAREREAARGDRRPGLADQQFGTIHSWLEYDLLIDTSQQAPREAALLIVAALASGKRAGAQATVRKLGGA